ncbi:hypothetical protein [Sphingobacterium bambusae]|uniref:DUF4397 domain-containing protein n=1 Tax=Sphingobacterium bambusae TaxID=662858 RepID=A0ABW6BLN5_9SPHI|nr:hypothetical protein [Sphingobacterium bambusae]WPL48142.1 hypothetical protein SCB77_19500 [Sphingobacterium bambusae]
MRKIFYLTLFSLLLVSCKKGEYVEAFENLSNVYLSGNFNGISIYRNDQQIFITQNSIKVPIGQATYRFLDVDGKRLLEEMVAFDNTMDTISLLNNGESSLLLRSLGNIAVNPERFKIDLANIGMFNNGAEVNIVACMADGSLMPVSEPEIISNISNRFANNFAEFELGGYASSTYAETAGYYILFYPVDSEMEPYLHDGYPILFALALAPHNDNTVEPAGLNKVYQIALRDDVPSDYLGMIPGIGIYPEGSSAYFVYALQSK